MQALDHAGPEEPVPDSDPVAFMVSIIRAHNWSSALQVNSPGPAPSMSIIAQDMRELDRVIADRLVSGVPLVGQVAHYIIAAGGKRLRPSLLLLTCGALGYRDKQRFNLAAVVEFINKNELMKPASAAAQQ